MPKRAKVSSMRKYEQCGIKRMNASHFCSKFIQIDRRKEVGMTGARRVAKS
jgi:hypothetical protein